MRLRLVLVTLLLFVSTLVAQGATVQFSPRQDIPTQFQHLNTLAVADFNGDGKPDIVVADVYTQNLVIYLNDGQGNFPKPLTVTYNSPGGTGIFGLVAGDVNGDGKQDLVIGIGGQQVDVVLLGNGDGTFTQGETIPGSYGFFRAVLIDINDDKHPDLLTTIGGLLIFLGDGKGHFYLTPAVLQTAEHSYSDIVAGDFDGNGRIDFVALDDQNDEVVYHPGLGNGAFGPPVQFGSPETLGTVGSLVAADLNGDGKLDLALGINDVALLLPGNGDGTFQTGRNDTLPLAYRKQLTEDGIPILATADMDGDGSADVVAADDSTDLMSVVLNDGAGNFSLAYSAPVDTGTGNIQLADLNGDGLPDIVLTNYVTQKISVFLSILPKTTPTVTLKSDAAQALTGSTVNVTVQVAGTGTGTPGGTVTLASGSTSYGQQTLDASGETTFTLKGLAAGQYSLIASYSGDSRDNTAANTVALVESITDFQVALPTPTQSVAVGGSATYGLNLTPVAGFAGSVAVSCSGLPAGYSCAPVSTALNGKAASANVVVSPPATTASLDGRSSGTLFGRPLAVCLSLSFCLALRRRRRLSKWMVLAVIATTAALGCGGGGNNKPPAYTGTSSFTITATATQGSASVSHAVMATLTVH